MIVSAICFIIFRFWPIFHEKIRKFCLIAEIFHKLSSTSCSTSQNGFWGPAKTDKKTPFLILTSPTTKFGRFSDPDWHNILKLRLLLTLKYTGVIPQCMFFWILRFYDFDCPFYNHNKTINLVPSRWNRCDRCVLHQIIYNRLTNSCSN